MKSIKFKLVALSVLISGVALAIVATLLFIGIRTTQQTAFDTALHNHAVDVAAATDLNFLGGLMVRRDVLIDEKKIFPFPLGESLVQIRTLDGRVVLSSRALGQRRLPLRSELTSQLGEGLTTFETIRFDGDDYRLVNYLISRPTVPPLILQLAVPTSVIEGERREILTLFWTWIPLVLAASAFAGLMTASRALEPMYRIINSARAIRPDQLSARVPVPEETELKQLAITLNALLKRLQSAFESQEQFIADASHQLKTPLAIMRGEIDVFSAGSEPAKPDASRALLTSVSQEIDQLTKMVDDLLLLARFDGGAQSRSFAKLRLDEVLIETIAKLASRAKEAQVEIGFDIVAASEQLPELEINGDFDLLRALFFNLIENAIKYTSKPGRIAIRLLEDSGFICVDVTDHGKGIPASELPRVFDRFYRGGKSQHEAPGVGLGLSIAQRIANFHGAELTVSSEENVGTTFSFRIKKL